MMINAAPLQIVCATCHGKGWFWGWTCDRYGRVIPAHIWCSCQGYAE